MNILIDHNQLVQLSYSNIIIVFDGYCVLCNRFMQSIIGHDKNKEIKYISFQNLTSQTFSAIRIPNSIIVINKGVLFTKSEAVFQLKPFLKGKWKLLLIGKLFPKFVRDYLYQKLAVNRYKIFGKTKTCEIHQQIIT